MHSGLIQMRYSCPKTSYSCKVGPNKVWYGHFIVFDNSLWKDHLYKQLFTLVSLSYAHMWAMATSTTFKSRLLIDSSRQSTLQSFLLLQNTGGRAGEQRSPSGFHVWRKKKKKKQFKSFKGLWNLRLELWWLSQAKGYKQPGT